MFLVGTVARFLSILFLVAFALSPSETKAGVDSIYVVTLNDGSIIKAKSYQLMGDDSIFVLSKWGRKHYLAKSDIRWLVRDIYKPAPIPGEKSPAGALYLSSLIPGLGQYYNKDYEKAISQFTLSAGTLGLAALLAHNSYDDSNRLSLAQYLLGISIVIYIWSMIDAAVSASRINTRLRKEHGDKETTDLKIYAGLLKHGNRNLPGIMAQLNF